MSTPNTQATFNVSKSVSEHLEKCAKLNEKAVNSMNSNQTQQELDNTMKSIIKEASSDLGRPMTYAEMRERFG